MNVYLIRHTSVNVPKGTCYGQTDVPLNNSFEEEAQVVKNQLKGKEFDYIYSSPLTRCKRLAHFCIQNQEINYQPQLMEMDFGDWEMTQWDQLDFNAWDIDWVNTPVPNGESFCEMYQRVADFLEKLKKESHENVAIFTHGGVLACANVFYTNIPLKNAFDNPFSYGEVLTFEV